MGESIYEVLKRHEGVVPHMYLDTTGNVTVGVGFLLARKGDVGLYDWDDMKAAEDDWQRLSDLADYTTVHNKTAGYYETLTEARLLDVDSMLAVKIGTFERLLARMGFPVSGFEWPLYQVCIDIAFQVGAAGLVNGFPAFIRAVRARDWVKASQECTVKQASPARNAWRTATVLKMVTPKHRPCQKCGK